MALLTLAEAKDDLGIVGTADDLRVQALLDAAVASAAKYIKRTIPWLDDEGVEVPVPDDVNAAIRLQLRALDHDADSVNGRAFQMLLDPHTAY